MPVSTIVTDFARTFARGRLCGLVIETTRYLAPMA